jgi:hypothetical protein
MKEDQELLETEASTMRRHQSMQRLSRGEQADSHMDEELVRKMIQIFALVKGGTFVKQTHRF